ncbi:hypothetical protein SAY87_001151 [Trapa incisa]|uniref:Uncharacterized protein n=1 Tax=Trapa incisa TaxID=236973 RepID=A0AAN7GCS2_9MYRT|nr:hypothetical protein SAY87_001151 [Trapa incisa]
MQRSSYIFKRNPPFPTTQWSLPPKNYLTAACAGAKHGHEKSLSQKKKGEGRRKKKTDQQPTNRELQPSCPLYSFEPWEEYEPDHKFLAEAQASIKKLVEATKGPSPNCEKEE